jgi:hypothetical protein
MFDHPIAKMIVLSGVLVLLIVVTHEAIVPLERAVFDPAHSMGILFYLPLGFWVLVAYYERWNAVLLLAPGFAIGLAAYGHPDLPLSTKLLQLAVMAMTAPAVFAVLSWASGRANEPMSEPYAWRFIVTAGAFTAVLNAVGLNFVRHGALPGTATIEAVVQFSAGGIVGLLSCLVLLAVSFRIRRQIQSDD